MLASDILLFAFVAVSIAGALTMLPWRRKARRNAEVITNVRLWRGGR